MVADKNFDSEMCSSIPLNFINQIQPHGILLVVDKSTMKIIQVSENIESLFDMVPAEFLNKPLSDFIDGDLIDQFKYKIDKWNIKDQLPERIKFLVGGKPFNFFSSVHYKDDYLLLEMEVIADGEIDHSFFTLYQDIKYVMAAIKQAKDIISLGDIIAKEIKNISGFDRVMVYSFDKTWNGKVLAEAKETYLDSYLDLHFPASDVPKQARELYFTNPYRLIPNRSYTPANMLPVINPLTRSFTDLSECVLRSVPSVHLEYLKNMNVEASMSTPIIVNNTLWGLISCHHATAKYLRVDLRSTFELLSQVISVQLSALENQRILLQKNRLHADSIKILEHLYIENDFVEGLLHGKINLQSVFNASGVAIIHDGEVKTIGEVPLMQQVKEIIKWLQRYHKEIYATDSLSADFYFHEEVERSISGLLSLPIEANKGNFILIFRPEIIQTLSWGGNPYHAVQFESDGVSYHPRKSFEVWKESIKNISESWLDQELETAEIIRTAILERIIRDRS